MAESKIFEVLEEHITYHTDMMSALVEMRDSGNLTIALPTKPKSSLKDIIKGRSKDKKEIITIENLHDYLKSKEVALHVDGVWQAYVGENMDAIAANLKEGQIYVETLTKKLFCHYVNFGGALEQAYYQFSLQKEERHADTW